MSLRDTPREVDLRSRERVYSGAVWDVDFDEFELDGTQLGRDFMVHMGAVAVLALDDAGRILVITQYRHPVGHDMVELPAGLLDIADEEPLAAAQRELLEETGYTAANWRTLLDFCTSPGSTSEAIRVFVASDLTLVGRDEDWLEAEERLIEVHWVELAAAVEQILAGNWQNPTAVAGILAFAAAQGGELRDPDAPWPMRGYGLATGRVFRKGSEPGL